MIRIDAALSFANANHVKRLCLDEAAGITVEPQVLIVDCSGINDIDATGVDSLAEIVTELDESPVTLHLCDVKGPVRDVLRRSDLWGRLEGRVHATVHQAVITVAGAERPPPSLRSAGIDENGPHLEPSRA